MIKDVSFGLVLLTSALMVSFGVGYYTFGGGLIAGGLLLAAFGWLIFGEVDN